jgi:hypothetical protein
LHSCFSEHSLGDAAVLAFCAYLSLQVKAIKSHLALLKSSSHRLFRIGSPYPAIQGMVVGESWPGQKSETLPKKRTKSKRTDVMGKVVEHLLNKLSSLSHFPVLLKNQKTKKRVMLQKPPGIVQNCLFLCQFCQFLLLAFWYL